VSQYFLQKKKSILQIFSQTRETDKKRERGGGGLKIMREKNKTGERLQYCMSLLFFLISAQMRKKK